MRRIGGHVSVAGGVSKSIENSRIIGGNCLQIFAGSPRLWARSPFPSEEVDKFLSLSKNNDIDPVFIHALYLVNLASDNQDLLFKSINSLVADLKNGSLINSAGIIVHIGSHQGRGFQTVKKQLISSIKEILSRTEITNLILENDAGQNGKIGSPEELAELINEINDPRLKICFDTAHLFESGIDLRDSSSVDRLVSFLKAKNILDRLVCIHLNDSATTLDSHRDMHANLGEGEIGLAGLSNLINHPDLKHLPLILETPGDNREGPNEKNITVAKSLL